MAVSFASLWEKASQRSSIFENVQPSLSEDGSKYAITLAKQEPEFLKKLGSISNSNRESLGQLLGVDSAVVAKWNAKIQEAIKEAAKETAETQQKVVLSTGV